MNEFIVRIEAPELSRAITNLASALSILCVTAEEQGIKKPVSTGSTNNAEERKEAPTETKEQPQPQHTIEEVRAAFSEYAKSKGKDKAKELLSRYGAAKVTELKAEDYDAAIRDIREG